MLIPVGTLHSIRMWGDVTAQSLYFEPSLQAQALAHEDCLVLSVTPLLAALVTRVIELAALDTRVPAHQALLTVLLNELDASPDRELGLPLQRTIGLFGVPGSRSALCR